MVPQRIGRGVGRGAGRIGHGSASSHRLEDLDAVAGTQGVGDVNLLPAVLRAADQPDAAPDDAVMASLSERAGFASIFGL